MKAYFLCFICIFLCLSPGVFSLHLERDKRSIPGISFGSAPRQNAICGQKNSIEEGTNYTIKSPFYDYGFPYPMNSRCTWEFYGSGGCQPIVNCSSFAVTASNNCSSDYLEVSDGVGASQKFCGTSAPQNVSSGISILRIFFKSGPFSVGKGFSCLVSCAANTANSTTTSSVNIIPNALGKPETANCSCGVPGNVHRVVGGENALPEYWKWQTAIRFRSRSSPFCGGSIINSKFVLTAAHCVITTGLVAFPAAAEAVFNEYDTRTTNETKTIIRSIVSITPHPFYDPLSQDYDVAVLEIYPPLNLTSTEEPTLTPVCLPPRGSRETYVNQTATVVGWGTLTEGGDQATVLQQANIPVISNEECNKQYSNRITPRMLCAHYPGVDSCQGDSGGPFMLNSNSKFVQIGVVSFGEGCARAEAGVYSSMNDLNDWVRQTAWRGVWCKE